MVLVAMAPEHDIKKNCFQAEMVDTVKKELTSKSKNHVSRTFQQVSNFCLKIFIIFDSLNIERHCCGSCDSGGDSHYSCDSIVPHSQEES